jgi:predicted flap endonuclease-1-like 5' DNA nuclease
VLTDLAPIQQRMAALESAVGGIKIPAPVATDLTPVQQRLAAVESAVAAIKIPAPVATDLTPVQLRLAALDHAVAQIKIPSPVATDLGPLASRVEALDRRLAALRIPEPTPAPNLQPLADRVAAVERAVAGIRIPEPPKPETVDLTPVHQRLRALDAAIANIKIPAPTPATDLSPLLARLGVLEQTLSASLEKLRRPPPPPPAPPAPAVPAALVRSGSRNLLTHAALGKPDDLKRIKGVAHVLERMLNGIGVYYFWQIAEWSAADIVYVDSQLTAFKGRISRDNWVKQSRSFAAEPGTAKKPGG